MNATKTIALGVLSGFAALSTQATTINYDLTWDPGTETGQYEFTVTNDSLSDPLDWFTIIFDNPTALLDYDAVVYSAVPLGWSPLVFPEDDGVPAPAMADASIGLGLGIAPGDTLGGFVVSFKYAGPGTPGSQDFVIYDTSFNELDAGRTSAVPDASSTGACLVLGIAALAGLNRRSVQSNLS